MATEQATVGQHTGHVKWFNNRRGYGFLKIVSDDRNGEDVFVHQTNVNPATSEYRALYPGEYVSFDISNEEKTQAVNVRGVLGGPLMCDQPRPERKGRGRGNRSDNEESNDQ